MRRYSLTPDGRDRPLFEPADRPRVRAGSVDPGAQVRSRVVLTGPTPVEAFCLIPEPRLLMTGAPSVAGR